MLDWDFVTLKIYLSLFSSFCVIINSDNTTKLCSNTLYYIWCPIFFDVCLKKIRKNNYMNNYVTEYLSTIIKYAYYRKVVENYELLYNKNDTRNIFLLISRSFFDLSILKIRLFVYLFTPLSIIFIVSYPLLREFFAEFADLFENINDIPMEDIVSFVRAVQNGQSLYISYNQFQIVSVPAKIHYFMTENELEERAPKCITYGTIGDHTCSICFEDCTMSNQLYRILPKCNHLFHCACVDKWFFSGHSECPNCRTLIC